MREVRMILTSVLVVFVVLKLTGLVDWSWWIVAAPFWIPLVGWLLFVLWLLVFGRESSDG